MVTKTKAALILSLSAGFVNAQNNDSKPNVIVIMADDLGYADVSFNGSTEIPTPNIDRIANNGVKFTSGYTTYSVSGPSRAGFMTGRYQQRFGFERNPLYRVDDQFMGLPQDEITIAESVSQVGYTTGVIGKWHLGAHISNHPLNRGFDEFYGHLGGGHRYFPEDLTIQDSYSAKNESESYLTWILRNHTPEQTDEYITDEFSNEAVEFVSRHKEKPFFLFLSYNAPHSPMQAKPEDLALFPNLVDTDKRKRKTYAAMVHAVDRGVGRLMDKLEELNLDENTIVFFLSDNGGPESKNASNNGILRGGKSDVYEGGYRVPFAMQWKGNIEAGQTYDYPVSSLDIFATLSALSNSPVNPEKPLDGVNLIPYLTGENTNRPHETIYLRKFDQDRHAVRHGDFKILYLMDRTNQKLFDLNTNISEVNDRNLYWNADFKTKRDELDALMEEWEADLKHPYFLGLIHDDGEIWATGLNLDKTDITINIDGSEQLTATILPNDAFNNVVEWTSSNAEVATVNENGLITAKKQGYTVITARVVDRRQVFTHCIVKVGNPAEATAVSLSESNITVVNGKTIQLSATVSSSGSDGYTVEWTSSNTAVATVDENGFIFTHSVGTATITAKVVGNELLTDVCTINVNEYTEKVPNNIKKKTETPDDIKIYPNPVSTGFLFVDFNINAQNVKAEMLNSFGQILSIGFNEEKGKLNFNTSKLKPGIYFIKLNFNNYVVTKKIIVN